jgi:hypothetical protein
MLQLAQTSLYATNNILRPPIQAIETTRSRPFGPHTCLTVHCQPLHCRPDGCKSCGSAAVYICLDCLWPAASTQAGACRLLQRKIHRKVGGCCCYQRQADATGNSTGQRLGSNWG